MRILLVEDHSAMRFGIRTFLQFVGKMEVAGEAEDADTALRLVQETQPNLVLLDLRLKGDQDGLGLCREIKALNDPPRVLVHTAFNSGDEMLAAMLAGADGFVHKGVDHERLPQTIRDVYSGETVWLTGDDMENKEFRSGELPGGKLLTLRESEVAGLVIRRYTNAEIAEDLRISLPTVKSHVGSILKKLDLESRRDLVQRFSSWN